MSYKEIQPGDIIKVKITAVKPYGAFFETRDRQVGLIHMLNQIGRASCRERV